MAAQMVGKAKLHHVTEILTELRVDLDASVLPNSKRLKLLQQLKLYGRSVNDAGPIFQEEGLRTLGRYAFEGDSNAVSQEALRCIANALLLVPKTRQMMVSLGHGLNATNRIKSESVDDEFLASRVLFLMTYDTKLDYAKLVTEHRLADNIDAILLRHAKYYSKAPKQPRPTSDNSMELMALSEVLKLIFNVTHFHPGLKEHFSKSIPNILKILVRRDLPAKPLEAPFNFLINALLNLDLEDYNGKQQKAFGYNALFPAFDPKCNAERMVKILNISLMAYPQTELDNTIAPILTLIRRIYELAPEPIRRKMQELILPTQEERDKPIGKSATLSSRLLNLSTSAFTPNLRGSISAMFFEFSGKDPAAYVQNVGYGFASGFLMSNNIPLPSAKSGVASPPLGAPSPLRGINPVTGQRLDMEVHPKAPPMSYQEKEQEAEKLFVLFERLKKTGVVDVKNPVEEMYRTGRIQELPDDD